MTIESNILRSRQPKAWLSWRSKQRKEQDSDPSPKSSTDGNSVVFMGY